MRILLAVGLINLGIGLYGASFYFTNKIIQRGTMERIAGVTCVNGKVGYIQTSNNKKEIVFPKDQNNQQLICLQA